MSLLKKLRSSTQALDDSQVLEIVEAYRQDLLPFLKNRVGSDADEVFSDIRLEFHRRIGTLRDPSQIKNFLFQVARDTVKKHWLHQHRSGEIPEHMDLKDTGTNLEADLLNKERVQALRDCIMGIASPKVRGVAHLRYGKNFPHAQIRDELELTTDQVKKMIKKAEIAITDCVRSRFQN